MANPALASCGRPNAAATSGRAKPYGATPTNTGGAPDPGFGYAHTCSVSTPVPWAAPRSAAHPAIANMYGTVAFCAGRSTAITGLERATGAAGTVTRTTLTLLNVFATVLRDGARQIGGGRPRQGPPLSRLLLEQRLQSGRLVLVPGLHFLQTHDVRRLRHEQTDLAGKVVDVRGREAVLNVPGDDAKRRGRRGMRRSRERAHERDGGEGGAQATPRGSQV